MGIQDRLKLIDVLYEIETERRNQENKWGSQNHCPVEWLAILGEEVGEANKHGLEAHFAHNPNHWPEEYKEGGNVQVILERQKEQLMKYRAELVQVAAVAVAMIESLDRNEFKTE